MKRKVKVAVQAPSFRPTLQVHGRSAQKSFVPLSKTTVHVDVSGRCRRALHI